MAILIPNFKESYGLSLTVCGQIIGRKPSSKPSQKKEKYKVARFRTTSGAGLVRCGFGGKSGRHLHVDCTLSKLFSKGRIPKATHKKEEVLEIVENHTGEQVDAHIIGCFVLPIEELPDGGLIRSLNVEHKTVDMSIKLSGCEMSLTGAPIDRIKWRKVRVPKDSVYVELKGERKLTVTEDYLKENWDWVCEQFESFILGRRKDENK